MSIRPGSTKRSTETITYPLMFGDANNEISQDKKDEPIRISGFHNFGFGANFNEIKLYTDASSSIVTLDNPVEISENTAHSRQSPDSSNSPPLVHGKSLYVQSRDIHMSINTIEHKRNPFSS